MISEDKQLAGFKYSDFIDVSDIDHRIDMVDCLFTMAEIKYWGETLIKLYGQIGNTN